MLALAYDGLEAARHHDSVVALQPDLLVELMTPLRRDGPGPFIGRARHHLGELLYRVQYSICQSVSTNTHEAHRLLVIFVQASE